MEVFWVWWHMKHCIWANGWIHLEGEGTRLLWCFAELLSLTLDSLNILFAVYTLSAPTRELLPRAASGLSHREDPSCWDKHREQTEQRVVRMWNQCGQRPEPETGRENNSLPLALSGLPEGFGGPAQYSANTWRHSGGQAFHCHLELSGRKPCLWEVWSQSTKVWL